MKNIKIYMALALMFAFSCKTVKQKSHKGYGNPSVEQAFLNESTFLIEKYSIDNTYGYVAENPIMVGGAKTQQGPLNQRRFLNALAGPNGEEIGYYRVGSCCHFKTRNGVFGDSGLLDIYNVFYDGIEEAVSLYINMYDSDTLKVPVGFTLRHK
jgi:hypothetical protein